MSADPSKRPAPADFRDYKAYLRAMIAHLRATASWFSYRNFSRRAGYSSPNFLKKVAEGERNISRASIDKFADGLGLREEERADFESLVLLDLGASDEERNLHYQRLSRRMSQEKEVLRIEADQYQVYTRWWALVIRELIASEGLEGPATKLAGRLLPRVKAPQAEGAVKLLRRLGLVVETEDGSLTAAQQHIGTTASVRSLAIRNFHRAMLKLAARALDSVPRAERNITSLTIPMTPAQYERAVKRIYELRQELLAESEQGSDEDSEIHQLMFCLFPVTKRPR